jgi:hypothetical protein
MTEFFGVGQGENAVAVFPDGCCTSGEVISEKFILQALFAFIKSSNFVVLPQLIR